MERRKLPPDLPVVGDVFVGKYRIERILGSGGMGIVFAAVHVHLDQHVALKVLLPEHVNDTDVVTRFLREGRAAAKIRSEHVCRVFDVGSEGDLPYLVLEYLDGTDLAQLVAGTSGLPISTAIDHVLQACDAIAEAHARGIVHRDLKPSNLFLARVEGGTLIKVFDFGISKMEKSNSDVSTTSTSWFAGSPSYMSPEQWRSAKTVDARADIWAIGAILFELLTGSVPFRAESLAELAALVLSGTRPSARALRSDVPPPLDAIIQRCLQKDPADRFQSVRDLVEQLAPFGTSTSARAASRVLRDSAASISDVSSPRAHVPSVASSELSIGTRAHSTLRVVGVAFFVALLAGSALTIAARRARTSTAAAAGAIPPAQAVAASVDTPPAPSSAPSASGAPTIAAAATAPAASPVTPAPPSSVIAEPSTTPRPRSKPPRTPTNPTSPSTRPTTPNKTSTDFTNDRRG